MSDLVHINKIEWKDSFTFNELKQMADIVNSNLGSQLYIEIEDDIIGGDGYADIHFGEIPIDLAMKISEKAHQIKNKIHITYTPSEKTALLTITIYQQFNKF